MLPNNCTHVQDQSGFDPEPALLTLPPCSSAPPLPAPPRAEPWYAQLLMRSPPELKEAALPASPPDGRHHRSKKMVRQPETALRSAEMGAYAQQLPSGHGGLKPPDGGMATAAEDAPIIPAAAAAAAAAAVAVGHAGAASAIPVPATIAAAAAASAADPLMVGLHPLDPMKRAGRGSSGGGRVRKDKRKANRHADGAAIGASAAEAMLTAGVLPLSELPGGPEALPSGVQPWGPETVMAGTTTSPAAAGTHWPPQHQQERSHPAFAGPHAPVADSKGGGGGSGTVDVPAVTHISGGGGSGALFSAGGDPSAASALPAVHHQAAPVVLPGGTLSAPLGGADGHPPWLPAAASSGGTGGRLPSPPPQGQHPPPLPLQHHQGQGQLLLQQPHYPHLHSQAYPQQQLLHPQVHPLQPPPQQQQPYPQQVHPLQPQQQQQYPPPQNHPQQTPLDEALGPSAADAPSSSIQHEGPEALQRHQLLQVQPQRAQQQLRVVPPVASEQQGGAPPQQQMQQQGPVPPLLGQQQMMVQQMRTAALLAAQTCGGAPVLGSPCGSSGNGSSGSGGGSGSGGSGSGDDGEGADAPQQHQGGR